MAVVNMNLHPNETPFTMEEVTWAIKGGYFDDLVSHYMKNGGL